MSKRLTQAERTEASDSAMLKAAISIIATEGHYNMTLIKVGKKAGFTGGLVSYRFGSKSGLLQAVAERILELWNNRNLNNKKLVESSGVEQLKLIAEAYLNDVKKRSDLMVALHRLMNASYGSCPDLLPYFQEFDNSVRARISKTITDSGQAPATFNADAFAVSFMALLRGVSQQYYIDQKNVDLKQTKIMIWNICDAIIKD